VAVAVAVALLPCRTSKWPDGEKQGIVVHGCCCYSRFASRRGASKCQLQQQQQQYLYSNKMVMSGGDGEVDQVFLLLKAHDE
jgi:hypothetical protein